MIMATQEPTPGSTNEVHTVLCLEPVPWRRVVNVGAPMLPCCCPSSSSSSNTRTCFQKFWKWILIIVQPFALGERICTFNVLVFAFDCNRWFISSQFSVLCFKTWYIPNIYHWGFGALMGYDYIDVVRFVSHPNDVHRFSGTLIWRLPPMSRNMVWYRVQSSLRLQRAFRGSISAESALPHSHNGNSNG